MNALEIKDITDYMFDDDITEILRELGIEK